MQKTTRIVIVRGEKVFITSYMYLFDKLLLNVPSYFFPVTFFLIFTPIVSSVRGKKVLSHSLPLPDFNGREHEQHERRHPGQHRLVEALGEVRVLGVPGHVLVPEVAAAEVFLEPHLGGLCFLFFLLFSCEYTSLAPPSGAGASGLKEGRWRLQLINKRAYLFLTSFGDRALH